MNEEQIMELREACAKFSMSLQPMIVMQPLTSAVEEFIDAVSKLRAEFQGMTRDRAIDIVLELKRMGLPREVK